MPDLTDGWAVVIAAVISVGGMVLTQYFNWRQRKIDYNKNFSERYFYEAYKNRIDVYKDVISVLSGMRSQGNLPPGIPAEEIKRKFDGYVHDLNTILVRLRLFGSSASYLSICSFLSKIEKISIKDRGTEDIISTNSRGETLRHIFTIELVNTLKFFSDIIRRETGANFVDRVIFKSGKGVKPVVNSCYKSYRQHAGKKNKKKQKWDHQ